MKKNISFIIISLLIINILFVTAATCNMCGKPLEISIGSTGTEDTEKQQIPQAASGQEQSSNARDQQEGNSSPTIDKIEIAGMDIDEAVQGGYFDELPSAEAEGAEITVSVQASDSDGDALQYISYDSLGTDFEVNVIDNNNAEIFWAVPVIVGPYRLVIEVLDDKGGKDSYAVDMTFYDSSEDLPAEGVNEVSPELVYDETGMIEANGSRAITGYVYAGDMHDSDEYFNGYISFDISDLTGIEVVSVTLTMNLDSEHGNRSYLGNLRIGTIDYGTGALSASDADIPAELLVSLPNSTTHISYSSDELADELQKNINSGKDRFQLKLYWSHPGSNLDDASDGLIYAQDDIHLAVQYIE